MSTFARRAAAHGRSNGWTHILPLSLLNQDFGRFEVTAPSARMAATLIIGSCSRYVHLIDSVNVHFERGQLVVYDGGHFACEGIERLAQQWVYSFGKHFCLDLRRIKRLRKL